MFVHPFCLLFRVLLAKLQEGGRLGKLLRKLQCNCGFRRKVDQISGRKIMQRKKFSLKIPETSFFRPNY